MSLPSSYVHSYTLLIHPITKLVFETLINVVAASVYVYSWPWTRLHFGRIQRMPYITCAVSPDSSFLTSLPPEDVRLLHHPQRVCQVY
jgi:hypothetical protein